jgi:signal transduction histidine kinase
MQTGFFYIFRLSPIPIGFYSILAILLLTLNIRLVTRLPYRIVLLISLLGLVFNGSIETVVTPLMQKFLPYSEIIINPYSIILFFLPQTLIMLIFITACESGKISLIGYHQGNDHSGEYLSKKEFNKILKADIANKQNLFVLIVLLLPLFLLVILNRAYYAYRLNVFPEEHLEFFAGLIGLFIVVLTVLSYAAVKKIVQYVENEYEAKRAVENLKQIEQLIDSSRKQRHDFYHQLQTVYGLLEGGSFERARDYISKMFNAISKTGELIKTDNFSVSALLNTKIGLAEAKNIDLEITVECSLKEMTLTPLESSSLLGNLIDNALEAVEGKSAGHRQVKVEITLEQGVYVITCSNTGDPIDPEARKNIFKPDFTTKEGHSGLGLTIVQDIANKYEGSISIRSDDQETTFTVTIPLSHVRDDIMPL